MLILLIPEINNRKFSFHQVIAFQKKFGTPRLQLQGASPLAAPDLSHPRHLGTLKPTLLHLHLGLHCGFIPQERVQISSSVFSLKCYILRFIQLKMKSNSKKLISHWLKCIFMFTRIPLLCDIKILL